MNPSSSWLQIISKPVSFYCTSVKLPCRNLFKIPWYIFRQYALVIVMFFHRLNKMSFDVFNLKVYSFDIKVHELYFLKAHKLYFIEVDRNITSYSLYISWFAGWSYFYGSCHFQSTTTNVLAMISL